MEYIRDPDFDFNMKILYYFGVWKPQDEPYSWQRVCRSVFIYVLYANAVYQILVTYGVDIYLSLEEPTACLEDLIYVLQFVVAVSKIATIFYQPGKILHMYHTIKKLREVMSVKDEYETELMKLTDFVCTVMNRSAVLLFNVFCISFNVSFYLMIGRRERMLQGRGWLPYDAKGVPGYELTFIGMGMELHLYASMIAATDVLFIGWLINIIAQLKMMNHRFLNIRTLAGDNLKARWLRTHNASVFQTNFLTEFPSSVQEQPSTTGQALPTNEDKRNKSMVFQLLGMCLPFKLREQRSGTRIDTYLTTTYQKMSDEELGFLKICFDRGNSPLKQQVNPERTSTFFSGRDHPSGTQSMRDDSRSFASSPNSSSMLQGNSAWSWNSGNYHWNRNPSLEYSSCSNTPLRNSSSGQLIRGLCPCPRRVFQNRNTSTRRQLVPQEHSGKRFSHGSNCKVDCSVCASFTPRRKPMLSLMESGLDRRTSTDTELSAGTGSEGLFRRRRRRGGTRRDFDGGDDVVWSRIKQRQDERERERMSRKVELFQEMKRLLAEQIQIHQEILRLWKLVGSTFNTMLLFQLICYLGLTALISYYIALIPKFDAKAMGMVQVMLGSVFELFVSCLLATLITEEYSSVRESIYASEWLDTPADYKRLMNIVISMANRPVGLSIAGYLELSLEIFRTVSRMSYSLFTTINTTVAVVSGSLQKRGTITQSQQP